MWFNDSLFLKICLNLYLVEFKIIFLNELLYDDLNEFGEQFVLCIIWILDEKFLELKVFYIKMELNEKHLEKALFKRCENGF